MSDSARLRELDNLLATMRLSVQRPGYRRRLLQGLDIPGGITALRLLRAVEVLSVGGGAPSIKEVATRLMVEHSTASRSVDTAVRTGLIRKRQCTTDQRRTLLELTSLGVGMLQQSATRRSEMLTTITEDWSDADIDRLITLLVALQEGYDRLEDAP